MPQTHSMLVVFGSGGHTAEMLGLLEALPQERYTPRTYVVADTDSTSEPKAKASKAVPADAHFLRIPRSREVGQSYVSAVFSTMWALLACFRMLWSLRPALVLVNGPGTCLPVCVVAAVLRLLCLSRSRVVFVESVCRVKTLSLTGKILYHSRLADAVHVQWPQLVERYPRARCVGRLL